MVTLSLHFQTLDDLRDYVTEILCQFEELERDAFPLTERLLLKAGAPCGLSFCLHGPRSVKFFAIWDAFCNAVLFYGPDGQRFQKTQLASGPDLELAAA